MTTKELKQITGYSLKRIRRGIKTLFPYRIIHSGIHIELMDSEVVEYLSVQKRRYK
jgi:hypothetical protein